MLEALIAGERDPRTLADLARGNMVVKKAALAQALTGQFEDHHAFLCRTLLDTIDYLGTQIDSLTTRITQAGGNHPIETPVRRAPLKIGTTTATYSPRGGTSGSRCPRPLLLPDESSSPLTVISWRPAPAC
jgi:hypothetical protein